MGCEDTDGAFEQVGGVRDSFPEETVTNLRSNEDVGVY